MKLAGACIDTGGATWSVRSIPPCACASGPVALNILAAILVLLFHGRDGRFYGVFSAIPGSLLLGLWCFRPAILYINVKQSAIMTGDFR